MPSLDELLSQRSISGSLGWAWPYRGSSVVDRFIARANIDDYLGLLNDHDLSPEKHAMVTKLLIAEEDKLGNDLEQLEFAESRAAQGRDRLHKMRVKCYFAHPEIRAEAERLVYNFEAIQELLEGLCHQLRAKASSRL